MHKLCLIGHPESRAVRTFSGLGLRKQTPRVLEGTIDMAGHRPLVEIIPTFPVANLGCGSLRIYLCVTRTDSRACGTVWFGKPRSRTINVRYRRAHGAWRHARTDSGHDDGSSGLDARSRNFGWSDPHHQCPKNDWNVIYFETQREAGALLRRSLFLLISGLITALLPAIRAASIELLQPFEMNSH
jgi:hypothetical protein